MSIFTRSNRARASLPGRAAGFAAIIVLSACVAPMDQPGAAGDSAARAAEPATPTAVPQVGVSSVDASAPLSASAADLAASSAREKQRSDPTIYYGNDQLVRLPAAQPPVKFIGDDVSLNFEQAPLDEVMHAIMGDILGLDYVVDQQVKGNITLRTRTPIPRDELLGVLESLLRSNGTLLVRSADGRYLVTGVDSGSELYPGVSSRGGGPGFSTVIVPLQYISASNMAEILKPVADESAFVRVDNARNILMLAGTRQQLDGWMDIITTFDVDLLRGMSVGLFPLENSDVEEVAAGLEALVGGGGSDSAEGDGERPLAGLVRVVPVKRLNSVMVVTPRRQYLDTLRVWIERLDSEPDSRFEKRLFVYAVQNTSAARLADLLNRIYADDTVAAPAERERSINDNRPAGRKLAPGMTAETLGEGTSGGFDDLDNMGRDSESEVSVVSQSFGGGSTLTNVRVVADDDNNALMIYATGKQYEIIREALLQLDIVATQVVIEASILEVQLTDDLRYGLEWAFTNGLGDGYKGEGILSVFEDGPASLLPGFSYSITDSSGDIRAVLNALSEESLINVISTPSVMVLDNHTAYIHVGDQVPIIDQQSTSDASDTSRITQSVVYKDTGVKLAVTPSVNAGGLVTMDVQQSVTDVGLVDSATGQRAFLERNITSRVAVRSEQSVVLGGLIRENATDSGSGVPFLHKLPVVGPLFGTVDKSDRRTELIVIITPRAIYTETELQQVSDEMRAQIRHMELIELPERQ